MSKIANHINDQQSLHSKKKGDNSSNGKNIIPPSIAIPSTNEMNGIHSNTIGNTHGISMQNKATAIDMENVVSETDQSHQNTIVNQKTSFTLQQLSEVMKSSLIIVIILICILFVTLSIWNIVLNDMM